MIRPLRVLLVEDSPTDAKLVLHELKRTGFVIESEQVETAEGMRAALTRMTWDLVISDWSMPCFSGPRALALVKELGLDVPFIIVSGTVGEEHAVAAMRAGAHDYVLKGKLVRLPAVVERETREHALRIAHRQAERARAEAELRFRRLFEAGIIGITIASSSGAIIEANDTFLAMVGYTQEDLAAGALNWNAMTPVDWRDHNAWIGEKLKSNGGTRPFEKEYLRKDGTRVPVLLGITVLDEGRVLMIVTDLTARRAAEQANSTLELQLRQSQKMEAVGRLAGGVAHDFNNLLSVVLSYSEMAMTDLPEGDPIRDDVSEIHRAGLRAADLTRQLLTFSRQTVVAPRVLDLNEVLTGMDKMLRRLVGEDVKLSLVTGGSLGCVCVDPGSIEQVIMNLVINARDAMPIGGMLTMETSNVVLDDHYVATHVDAKPGAYVMLSVSDTGSGMDKTTLARIFEPFFTTKERHKGTGLGLSTVFGIVQQSDGNIWVYSEPGIGSTFKVYLPRVDELADAAEPVSTNALVRGTETILLVEDEEQVREVARGILRRHGYTVVDAGTPGEALLLCEQHAGPIHLLLTDVVMPQMSGPELAKRLAIVRPDMKLLCMSGYTDDSAVRHGVIDASFAYLQKPLTVESLTRKVREVLD